MDQSWFHLFLAENTKRNEASARTYQVRRLGKGFLGGENSTDKSVKSLKQPEDPEDERTKNGAAKVSWGQISKTLCVQLRSLGFFLQARESAERSFPFPGHPAFLVQRMPQFWEGHTEKSLLFWQTDARAAHAHTHTHTKKKHTLSK